MPATFNMSDVMISYSRRDKAFVQRLNQSLENSGRNVWVDWLDIPATADWWAEIQAGIEAAHTFVFIISPESVRSEVCRKEIDHALACNKRLVPVLYKEVVDEADKSKMHPALNTHNWIYLRDTDDFVSGFKILVGALETDLQHVQAHTRFLVRANEWDFKKRRNSFLLRGEDLKDAEAWLRQGYNKQPNPTELQADYIEASRAAAIRFRTTVIGAMSAAMVILSLLACFAFSQANLAQTALAEAQAQGTEAANQAGIAQNNMVIAQDAENRRQTAAADGETQVFIAQENQTLAADAATLAGGNQMTANAAATQAANIQNTADVAATNAANAQATAGTEAAYLQVTSIVAATSAADANIKADDAQGTADSNAATAEAIEQLAIAQASTANANQLTAAAAQLTANANQMTAAAAQLTANANQLTATAAQLTANAVNVLGTQGALTATYAHDVARAFGYTATPASETALSISLAVNARAALERGDRPLAMHLALLAVKRPGLTVYADSLVEQIFYEVASSVGTRRVITNGQNPIIATAYNPQKRIMAIGLLDGTLQLWNEVTGTLEILWKDPDGKAIISVAFDKNGDYMAFGVADNTLKLLNLGSQTLLSTTTLPYGVLSVAFHPDQNYVVSASHTTDNPQDQNIRLWRVTTAGFQDSEAGLHTVESVNSVAFSPNGNFVVAVGYGGAQVLKFENGQLTAGQKLPGSVGSIVYSVAISPDSRRVVSDIGTTIKLWDVSNLDQPVAIGNPWVGHTNEIRGLAFSKNGNRVVSGSIDKTLIVWNVATGLPMGSVLTGHNAEVVGVAFSADERFALSASGDGTARAWDINTDQADVKVWNGAGGEISGVAFNASGNRVVSSTGGSLQLWDVQTGNIVATLPLMAGNVEVAFSPTGNYLVTGSDTGVVQLWDMSSSTPFATPIWTADNDNRMEGINSVAFSPSGNHIIVGAGFYYIPNEGYATLLDSSGRIIGNAPSQGSVVYDAAFASHKVCTATSCPVFLALRNGTLSQIDAITGNLIGTPWVGHTNIIWSTDASPYMKCPVSVLYLGTCVVTGARDRTIRIWNAQTGKQLGGAWIGHLEEVLTIVFSPDGNRVASGSGDGTVRLWNVVTGQQLGENLIGNGGIVTSLAFSRDGNSLVAGYGDGTLRLWNIRDLHELAAWVCGNRYARYMTDDELRQYGVNRAIDDGLAAGCTSVAKNPPSAPSLALAQAMADAPVIPSITPSATATEAFTPEVTVEITAEVTSTETPTITPTFVPTATLMLPAIMPPVFASMDDGAPFWTARGGWQLSDGLRFGEAGLGWFGAPESGTLTWEQSLDLRLSAAPQLRFMSLFNGVNGSLAAVEISMDGANWVMQAVAAPSALWQETVVDLSTYRGQVIWIRFTWVWQAGTTVDAPLDFWVLDAVSVVDAPPVVPTLVPTWTFTPIVEVTPEIVVTPTLTLEPTLTLAPVVEVTPEVTAEATAES